MGLIFCNDYGNVMPYITKTSCITLLLLITLTSHGYLLLEIWSRIPGINKVNTNSESGIFVTFVETGEQFDSILHTFIILNQILCKMNKIYMTLFYFLGKHEYLKPENSVISKLS